MDRERAIEVLDASDEDVEAAIHAALERAGCSIEELAAQARAGDFTSTDARLAWAVVHGLARVG